MVSHRHGIARVRRSIRQTVISTAIGASLGAGAVMVVVAATVAIMDRTPTAPRNVDRRADSAPHAAIAAAGPAPVAPAAAATAPARRAVPAGNPCHQQPWPYYDAACLTRTAPPTVPGTPGTSAFRADADPVPYFSASANTVIGASLAATGEPEARSAAPTDMPLAAPAAAPSVTAAPTTQPEHVREVIREPQVDAQIESQVEPQIEPPAADKPHRKASRRSAQRSASKAWRTEPSAMDPDATSDDTRSPRQVRHGPSDRRERAEGTREYSVQSYTSDDSDADQPSARTKRTRPAAERTTGRRKQPERQEEVADVDPGQSEPAGRGDFFGGLFGFHRDSWRN